MFDNLSGFFPNNNISFVSFKFLSENPMWCELLAMDDAESNVSRSWREEEFGEEVPAGVYFQSHGWIYWTDFNSHGLSMGMVSSIVRQLE